tara:strand:- start:44 stop:2161 length:2118 start_codon:yes stop_codon:yes gene_type:complete
MAAIQFPLNPTNGQVYFDAGNNVVYTWVQVGLPGQGYWSSNANDITFSGAFLKLDCSNGPLTGSLGVGEQNNIVLGTSGVGTFTGGTVSTGTPQYDGMSLATGFQGGYGVIGTSTGNELRLTEQGATELISNSSLVDSFGYFNFLVKTNFNKTDNSISNSGGLVVQPSFTQENDHFAAFYARPLTGAVSSSMGIISGFRADANLSQTGASQAIAYSGDIAANGPASTNYNLYMGGTAPNYLKGDLTVDGNVTFNGTVNGGDIGGGAVDKIIGSTYIDVSPATGIGNVTVSLDYNATSGQFVTINSYQDVYASKKWHNDQFFSGVVRAGDDNDEDQYLEMFIERDNFDDEDNPYTKRKVLQGNGNGPTVLRDSLDCGEVRLRNSGGYLGQIWLLGTTNGDGSGLGIFCNTDPGITKDGPRFTNTVTTCYLHAIKANFDATRGTQHMNAVAHCTMMGPVDTPTGDGFKTDYMYGLYLPDWPGNSSRGDNFDGAVGFMRGIYSEMMKGATWQAHFSGDCAVGTNGALYFPRVYEQGSGSGMRNVVINPGGWLTSDRTVSATLRTNVTMDSHDSLLKGKAQFNFHLTPRYMVHPLETEDEQINVPEHPGDEAYSPRDWGHFRLDPEQVAALHPRLAHYSWPLKTIVHREPGVLGKYDKGHTYKCKDYTQAPTPDGVDYDGIVTVLVGVVQELKSELDAAKTRLDALEAA